MDKVPLGMEVGLGPSDIMLDGDPALLPKKGAEPPILAHVYCSQMAGWIKMPLGMEIGLVARPHCARWGPSPQKGRCLLQPNGRPSQLLPSTC